MPSVSLTTNPRHSQKGLATNASPALTAAASAPASTLVVAPGSGIHSVKSSNLAKFVFFGVGDDNSEVNVTITTWNPVGSDSTLLWVPALVCKVKATLSTIVGIAGTEIAETNRIADTIILIDGDPTVKITSDVDAQVASLLVDLEGGHVMTLAFDSAGLSSSAASANYIFSTI